VLFGAGDLAEVAVLSASEVGIDILAVVDATRIGHCAGKPVVAELGQAPGPIDAVMLTGVSAPQPQLDSARAQMAALGLGPERLLVPELLLLRSGVADARQEGAR
jgi:hypothetical protein